MRIEVVAMKTLFVAVSLAILSACSGVSKSSCKNQNWAQVGQGDAEKGLPVTEYGSHQKSCGEFGINPDKKKYEEGHRLGARTYCKQQGLEHGKVGQLKKKPHLCRGVGDYDLALDQGFGDYCRGQGKRAGAKSQKTYGDKRCYYRAEYRSGFTKGLRSYCSPENGKKLGMKGIVVDLVQCEKDLKYSFVKAYKEGAKSYCRKENGFSLAMKGRVYYPQVCAQSDRDAFIAAYKDGIEYKSLIEQIENKDRQITTLEVKAADPKTSKDLKKFFKQKIKKLESKREVLKSRKENIAKVRLP